MAETFSRSKALHTFSTDGTLEKRLSNQDTGGSNQQSCSSQDLITCRICLEEEPRSSPTQTFIKPCSCSGSLEFIHESCMIEWLNTMIKHKIEAQQPIEVIHCQICKEIIDIDFKQKMICRNNEQIKGLICQYRPYFVLCVCLFFFTLGCLAVLLYIEFTSIPKTQKQKISTRIVLGIGYVVTLVCLTFWVYKFTSIYLVHRLTVIQKILPKREIKMIAQKGEQVQIKSKESQKAAKQKIVRKKIKIIRIEPQIDYNGESVEKLDDRQNQTL